MDINELRGFFTLLLLLTFIGICIWTLLGRPDRFDSAAALPFSGDEPRGTTRPGEPT